MNIIEEMAADRASMAFETITPLPGDKDLIEILGNALLAECRRQNGILTLSPVPTRQMVTQALALFHTWEANRK